MIPHPNNMSILLYTHIDWMKDKIVDDRERVFDAKKRRVHNRFGNGWTTQ